MYLWYYHNTSSFFLYGSEIHILYSITVVFGYNDRNCQIGTNIGEIYWSFSQYDTANFTDGGWSQNDYCFEKGFIVRILTGSTMCD